MTTSRDIAAWVAGATFSRMPDPVVDRARAAILDTTGAILAGVAEPVRRMASEVVSEDGCTPVATGLGSDVCTSMEGAALLNGISGHALDYDDVSVSATAHPSVVVLPAALAVAEALGASGRALIEGYVVGIEVVAKLGLAMGREHYRRGWHATSTLGTLGAAMAAGRVLGLDAHRLSECLAIAASQAGGIRQNFGTMTKPFHAGHAARCGVHAARLAARGVEGNIAALDGPAGYFTVFGFGEAKPDRVGPSLGDPYDLAAVGLSVKQYPCCYATHRAADAVLELRARPGVDAERVERLRVNVPPGALTPLLYERPETGLQGKFSMQYVVAAGLLDGHLGLDTFTDEMVRRPEVRAVLELTDVVEDPSIRAGRSPIDGGHVEVLARLRGGEEVACRVERAAGSPDRPLSRTQLAAKFRDCARALDPERMERALHRLEHLEELSDVRILVSDLTLSGR